MVHHKYIQNLIFIVCCLCIYSIMQIFEEQCLYYLYIHMYKENNLDLQLLQDFHEQRAVPLWTIQTGREMFWKCPQGIDCTTSLDNLCQSVTVLMGKKFLPISILKLSCAKKKTRHIDKEEWPDCPWMHPNLSCCAHSESPHHSKNDYTMLLGVSVDNVCSANLSMAVKSALRVLYGFANVVITLHFT